MHPLIMSQSNFNPITGFKTPLTDFSKMAKNLSASLQWLSLILSSVYFYIKSKQMKYFKQTFFNLKQ